MNSLNFLIPLFLLILLAGVVFKPLVDVLIESTVYNLSVLSVLRIRRMGWQELNDAEIFAREEMERVEAQDAFSGYRNLFFYILERKEQVVNARGKGFADQTIARWLKKRG